MRTPCDNVRRMRSPDPENDAALMRAFAGRDPRAADDLLANTSEADLLAMGIAAVPRPPEVNALLDSSAKRCGVTQDQLDAAAAA